MKLESSKPLLDTERKRWTEEQNLPALGNGSFRKAGSDHTYAIYERHVILALASSDIETWCSQRQAAARAEAAAWKTKRQEEQARES